MSRDKICHPHYQRVSGGSTLLPPKKQLEVFCFFRRLLIKMQELSNKLITSCLKYNYIV